MPKCLQFRPPVGEAKEMVVIVKVVGRQLLPLLHVRHSPTGESEVVPGKADRVCCARVVQDRGDREETLKVNVFRGIFPNDVGVGVNDAHHMENLLLRELRQLAVVSDKINHTNLGLCQLLVIVKVVHQHVYEFPGFWLVVPQPEDPQDHDGVVGGAGGLVVLDDEPGVVDLEQAALPRVRSILLLTVGTAKRPGAMATTVNQPSRTNQL